MKKAVAQMPWKKITQFVSVSALMWVLNMATAIGLMYVGVHYAIASTLGVVVHVTGMFFINRYWVFDKMEVGAQEGLSKTAFSELFIVPTMLLTMYVLVDVCGFDPEWSRPFASIPSGTLSWILHSWLVFGEHPFKKDDKKNQ